MPYEPTNGQTNAEQGGHERTTGPAATRVVKVVNHTLEIAPSMARVGTNQHMRRWARSRTKLTTESGIPRLAQYLDDLGAPRRRASLAGCRLEGS